MDGQTGGTEQSPDTDPHMYDYRIDQKSVTSDSVGERGLLNVALTQ